MSAITGCGLLLSVPAEAGPYPGSEVLPPTALSYSCSGEGETATFAAGFLTVVDLDGDGFNDYVVDYSKFHCREGDTAGCGNWGCGFDIYMGGANGIGAQPSLESQMLHAEIRRFKSYAVVVVENANGKDMTRLTAKGFRDMPKMPRGGVLVLESDARP